MPSEDAKTIQTDEGPSAHLERFHPYGLFGPHLVPRLGQEPFGPLLPVLPMRAVYNGLGDTYDVHRHRDKLKLMRMEQERSDFHRMLTRDSFQYALSSPSLLSSCSALLAFWLGPSPDQITRVPIVKTRGELPVPLNTASTVRPPDQRQPL